MDVETGLVAGNMELFGVFSGPELHYVYPNGDEVSNVDVVYLCRDYSGTLHAQEEEVDALRYFAAQELPDNISPPIRGVIRKWAEQKMQK